MTRIDDEGSLTRSSPDPAARARHQAGECLPDACVFCLEIHGRRIRKCRSCGADIIWFRTGASKQMPVDADSVAPGEYELTLAKGRHVSHFATCPNAAAHRRRR